jgi:hypothetical protein
VDDETGGPDTGPAPNVGGAPGVVGDGEEPGTVCVSFRHATADARAPSGAVIRNCRRVFTASGLAF